MANLFQRVIQALEAYTETPRGRFWARFGGLLVPALALWAIASRASRLLAHPPLIDVLAIVASLTLASVAIYEAFRGRAKRGFWLLAIESVFTLFVAIHLDVPWAMQAGASPALRNAISLHVSAPIEDLRGDPLGAAWQRVFAKAGDEPATFIGTPAKQVVAEHRCGELQTIYATYIASEPALQSAFVHPLAACAAANHNEQQSLDYYASMGRPFKNHRSYTIAADFAAMDGFPVVAIAAMHHALAQRTHDRTMACNSIKWAYQDRDRGLASGSALSQAVLAAGLPRCSAS